MAVRWVGEYGRYEKGRRGRYDPTILMGWEAIVGWVGGGPYYSDVSRFYYPTYAYS